MSISEISEFDRTEWTYPTHTQTGAGYFIDFGQFVCQPFFWCCEKLALQLIQPKDDRVFLIFKRCVSALLFALIGITVLPGWLLGSCLKMAGTALSGKPFIYKQGEGKERWGPKFTLLSFNACMYESGLPMLLGGVMPATYRAERLAAFIQKSDLDMVFLQELSLGPSDQLIEQLKGEYPHFYTNIGPATALIQHKVIGPELFIASKAPIVSEPKFIPFEQGAEHKLGFFCLETPTCWIINAHFPEEKQKAVLLQVSREIEKLKAQTGKPCILAGDLNYRKNVPTELFHNAGGNQPTCTNLLSARMFGKKNPNPPDELDDFILADRASFDEGKVRIEKMDVVELPDSDNPWKALSDHKPLIAQISTAL